MNKVLDFKMELRNYCIYLVDYSSLILCLTSITYLITSLFHLYLTVYFINYPDRNTFFYSFAVYVTENITFLKWGWTIPLLLVSIPYFIDRYIEFRNKEGDMGSMSYYMYWSE